MRPGIQICKFGNGWPLEREDEIVFYQSRGGRTRTVDLRVPYAARYQLRHTPAKTLDLLKAV